MYCEAMVCFNEMLMRGVSIIQMRYVLLWYDVCWLFHIALRLFGRWKLYCFPSYQ